MPFDGIVVKSVVQELSKEIVDGRIEKIYQPETDEIIIIIRANRQNLKLVLSASANHPRIHLTDSLKENPSSPPMFCMLLRKHLSGAKIINVTSHDYERIITILVESIDELGDLCVKKVVIEIMGRHSNIILLNSNNVIIDSIKHIDNEISRVREVMPARPYVFPPGQNKTTPDNLNVHEFVSKCRHDFNGALNKYLLHNIKGFSPILCKEVCFMADIDSNTRTVNLSDTMIKKLEDSLNIIINLILKNQFSPCIAFKDTSRTTPADFHCMKLNQYTYIKPYCSMNEALDTFYIQKDHAERLIQKKSHLFKIINNNIDRCNKKLAIHHDKLREVADRENLKLYGELITANIYQIPEGSKNISLLNYYSENGEQVKIQLDDNLSPQKNAQKYYKKYSKAKSAYKYSNRQIKEAQKELDYLESVYHTLESCSTVHEIEEVKEELIEQGYMPAKRKSIKKKNNSPSAPIHFKSTDGCDIYVGKNNRQNDYLTLKLASSNDIWLHTKDIPGSHVIIRKNENEITNRAIEEAATLAAYYSKARMSSNVPVDYTTVKNVKKPSKAKPGMVIYVDYKTIIVTPEERIPRV